MFHAGIIYDLGMRSIRSRQICRCFRRQAVLTAGGAEHARNPLLRGARSFRGVSTGLLACVTVELLHDEVASRGSVAGRLDQIRQPKIPQPGSVVMDFGCLVSADLYS